MSQSTNDVIPTAIRLGCLWRLDELLAAIRDIVLVLREKSFDFDQVLKSGRTHLQDAVPVRLGQEFSAYACAVDRDLKRIEVSSKGLRRLGIGGTAVGSGLNAHPDYAREMIVSLSKLTGLELELSDNLFESMQSMADMVDFSASLRTLALTFTRIANDLRLMASGPNTGLDEIRFPSVQPGSSIMPGKVNPVMAEMLNMAMIHVIAADTAVALSAQAGQLELNVMMPLIAHHLFEMMQVMIGSINAFNSLGLRGLQANPEHAARLLRNNPIIATALTPLIGYDAGWNLVLEAQKRGSTIFDLAIQFAREGTLLDIHTGQPVAIQKVSQCLDDLRWMTEGGLFGKALDRA